VADNVTVDRHAHHVLWHCPLLASSEYASLGLHGTGYRLAGTVVLPIGAAPGRIDYEVVVDDAWLPRVAAVSIVTPDWQQRIDLRSYGDGVWELGGVPAAYLDGCADVDLGWTPMTNTVPIRRLDLAVEQTARITAAWVRFPELDVVANAQTCTRLAADRWRYQSADYDFALVTDPRSGLVRAYGEDLWRAAAMS